MRDVAVVEGEMEVKIVRGCVGERLVEVLNPSAIQAVGIIDCTSIGATVGDSVQVSLTNNLS